MPDHPGRFDGARSPEDARGGLPARQLKQITDYIEDHLAEGAPVDELARIAGVTRQRFGARFKASTGLPPHRFLVLRRIHWAKLLLTSTTHSITAIASQVGFSHHSHFAIQFRRCTGLTPSQFRAQQT